MKVVVSCKKWNKKNLAQTRRERRESLLIKPSFRLLIPEIRSNRNWMTMKDIEQLLANNKAWAEDVEKDMPGFFP